MPSGRVKRQRDPWFTPQPPRDTILPLLTGIEGVRSGVSRRPVDAADRVAAIRWVARASDLPPARVALLEQVHGREVWMVPWEGFPDPVEGDALVTVDSGYVLSVRIADCAPVAVAAPGGEAVGLVHAGWGGLLKGVVQAGLQATAGAVGCDVGDITASIGPSIGPCCYEVGEEFRDRFETKRLRSEGGRLFLDLPGAVRDALLAAGVPARSIQTHAWGCTACGRGSPEGVSFHSHRVSGGLPGRNIAFIRKAGAGGNG